MKKNILTIVIMAATLVNLILTIVLVFSVMPAMNKTGNLVDKVASIIDLEIEDKDAEEEEYTVGDLEPYNIEYEKPLNINLQKDPGDAADKAHYAQLSGIVVSFNTKADDYSAISEEVQKADIYVQDIVKETIGEYSKATIDETKVKQEAVKKIREKYNTKCIAEISLKGFLIS